MEDLQITGAIVNSADVSAFLECKQCNLVHFESTPSNRPAFFANSPSEDWPVFQAADLGGQKLHVVARDALKAGCQLYHRTIDRFARMKCDGCKCLIGIFDQLETVAYLFSEKIELLLCNHE